jgi:hypothetical protein
LARVSIRAVVASGCVAILALDLLTAFASATLDFSYSALWPVPPLVYGTTAFLAAKQGARVGAGVIAGLSVATTEATLGWTISWLIGPGAPRPEDQAAGVVIAVALVVALGGAGVGLIGGLLGKRVATRRPVSTS